MIIVLCGSRFHWKHHGTNVLLTCLECVTSLSERSVEALPVSSLPPLFPPPRSLRVQLPAVNLHRDAAEDTGDQLTFFFLKRPRWRCSLCWL